MYLLELYEIGIFWSVSVSISWYLPYQYRRKTRSVQFGIKKGVIAPFFPQKGGNDPLFKELCPLLRKKRGNNTKRGERYRTKYRKPRKSDTSKIPIPKKLMVTPRYNSRIYRNLSVQLISPTETSFSIKTDRIEGNITINKGERDVGVCMAAARQQRQREARRRRTARQWQRGGGSVEDAMVAAAQRWRQHGCAVASVAASAAVASARSTVAAHSATAAARWQQRGGCGGGGSATAQHPVIF